jgi:hypothetical protein
VNRIDFSANGKPHNPHDPDSPHTPHAGTATQERGERGKGKAEPQTTPTPTPTPKPRRKPRTPTAKPSTPEPTVNPTPEPTPTKAGKGPGIPSKATAERPKAKRPSKTEATTKARLDDLRRKIAYGVGGVGVGVLALSVVHCTEAIGLLTGSPWYLSALLAIGVDAGMVLSELAELVAEKVELQRWARAYIGLSVGLSMGLNAYAFGMHASIMWAGVILGFVLPILVLMLGRIAGHLAK